MKDDIRSLSGMLLLLTCNRLRPCKYGKISGSNLKMPLSELFSCVIPFLFVEAMPTIWA